MEKMIINKELLSDCSTLLIALENCDVYEIDATDVVDLYCEVEQIGKSEREYRAKDGFIKISANASQNKERSGVSTELDCPLKERLAMCGGVDMTLFSLRRKQKRDIDVYVPYEPLEGVVRRRELELSNCPSLEIDDEGNMTIAFGKSSTQPKRKDNNYAELIKGWEEAFGKNEPAKLKVKIESLGTFGYEEEHMSFSFKLLDKFCKKGFAEFVFINCKEVAMEMLFPQNGTCEIVMSKMMDGRIYVGFDGLGISFVCDSIFEYEYYCKQDEE